MSQVSNMQLKRMVFAENTIPFHVKEQLFKEIDIATDNPRKAISPGEVLGSGLGGLTGFIMAKSFGAGPITTGLASAVGVLGGYQAFKRRPDEGQENYGTPGFYIPH